MSLTMNDPRKFKVVDMSEWRRQAESRKASGRGSVPMTPEHLLTICDSYEQMYQRTIRMDDLERELNNAMIRIAGLKKAAKQPTKKSETKK